MGLLRGMSRRKQERWEEKARQKEFRFTVADAQIARKIVKEISLAEREIAKGSKEPRMAGSGAILATAAVHVQKANHLVMELGLSIGKDMSIDREILGEDLRIGNTKGAEEDKLIGRISMMIVKDINEFESLSRDCAQRLAHVGLYSGIASTNRSMGGVSPAKAGKRARKGIESALQAFEDTKAQLKDSEHILKLITILEKEEMR